MSDKLQKGDRVKVWPHGKPEQSAIATVQIVSSNQLSIAVSFADKPPFAIIKSGIAIHPEHGIMLFASRCKLEGKAWGPWVEISEGGHFEMEKA